MKNLIHIIRHSQPGIFRILIFLLSLGAIVYVFPEKIRFRFDYKNLQGKPWPYENLTAGFDFAIKKSAEDLEKEKNETLNSFHAYYRMDPEAGKHAIEKFTVFMAEGGDRAGRKDIEMGKRLLDSLYKKGIIRLDEEAEKKNREYSINLLSANVATERDLRSFYTIQQAYTLLNEKLDAYESPGKPVLKNALENCIQHSVFFDEETSEKILSQSLALISTTRGMILKDQNIISKGELLTKEKYQVLESLSSEYESHLAVNQNSYLYLLSGQVGLIAFCLGIAVLFLYLFRKDVYHDNTRFFFILFTIVMMVVCTGLVQDFKKTNSFIIPFCIVPIIIRAFYDTRIALFVHLVMVMIVSFMVQNNFEFLFMQLTAGIMAIFSIANLRTRSQIFLTSLVVLLSYLFCYFSLRSLQDNSLQNVSWQEVRTFSISAALTLFSFPLIFMFEKIFGFVSDVTLMELSSNTKLLRELASKAPGTFQHSLQVAGLSEDVIYAIGGNPLLARAGALYHDVGKMDMPQYFTENRVSDINPHQELSHEESASIIIGHVIKGIEKARDYNIPDPVIDFIRTHHGTTRTEYFYRQHKQEFPQEETDESRYRYKGPLPYSKETAVVMICDSVEAASRSMKEYGGEAISNIVDAMIDRLVRENQFINADITFKDITLIRKTLKKKLMNIYHGRIEYPKG